MDIRARGIAMVLVAVGLVPIAAITPARASSGQVVLISQGEELDVYNPATGHFFENADALVKKPDGANGTPCYTRGARHGRFIEADDNPSVALPGVGSHFNG